MEDPAQEGARESYGVQDLYAAQQRRMLERLGAAVAILGTEPERAQRRDWEAFRQQLLALRAEVLIQEQIGAQLLQIHQRAIEE